MSSDSIVTRPQTPHDDVGDHVAALLKRRSTVLPRLADQEDIDDVVMLGMVRMPAVLDGAEIGWTRQSRLRRAGSRPRARGRTRRAHDHGERLAVQPDLERLLDRDRSVPCVASRVRPTRVTGTRRTPSDMVAQHQLARMRLQVGLSGQVGDRVCSGTWCRSSVSGTTSGTSPRRYSPITCRELRRAACRAASSDVPPCAAARGVARGFAGTASAGMNPRS